MEALFVYGTLKKGHKNHSYLAPALGRPATLEGLRLHPGPGYPYASLGPGFVQGEVYLVTQGQLEAIDRLEEAPDYYQRVRRLAKLADQSDLWVWVYLRPQAGGLPVLPGGCWSLGEERAG